MKVTMRDKTTALIHGAEHFDPEHTFMCGQCFRWHKTEAGTYNGVAYGKAVSLDFKDGIVIISNTTEDDVKNIWLDYLDLKRDYSAIKDMYSKDPYVSKAMGFGSGIHILNQDIFECLISFIISTQNQIPRIKKAVAAICEAYGTPCSIGDEVFYAFPTPEQLSKATEEELISFKTGYRAAYIVDAVRSVVSGEADLDKIKTLPYAEAKKELLKIKGVGTKVADCILLFSAGKSQAFPVDVWVSRTMRTLYMDESATNRQIEQKAAEIFGEFAGFAQQYLFYYARENGGIEK